jgi:hypothetical protein
MLPSRINDSLIAFLIAQWNVRVEIRILRRCHFTSEVFIGFNLQLDCIVDAFDKIRVTGKNFIQRQGWISGIKRCNMLQSDCTSIYNN